MLFKVAFENTIFRSPSCELNCWVKIVIGVNKNKKNSFLPWTCYKSKKNKKKSTIGGGGGNGKLQGETHITRFPWSHGQQILQAFHGQQMKKKFTLALQMKS